MTVTTWTFPATGGTPWDDLDQDQPWDDPSAAADRFLRAQLIDERFGQLGALEAEAWRRDVWPPASLPPHRVVADPEALIDNQVACAYRRRVLAAALAGLPDIRNRKARPRALPDTHDAGLAGAA